MPQKSHNSLTSDSTVSLSLSLARTHIYENTAEISAPAETCPGDLPLSDKSGRSEEGYNNIEIIHTTHLKQQYSGRD